MESHSLLEARPLLISSGVYAAWGFAKISGKLEVTQANHAVAGRHLIHKISSRSCIICGYKCASASISTSCTRRGVVCTNCCRPPLVSQSSQCFEFKRDCCDCCLKQLQSLYSGKTSVFGFFKINFNAEGSVYTYS